MDLRQIFATNLRKARHAKGLSQDALAFDAEMDRTHLSEIENGKTWVGLEIIGKLAAVLDVEPYELLMPPPRRKRPAQGGS
jgi:transcriptional regulator with XRE-family HTH domain